MSFIGYVNNGYPPTRYFCFSTEHKDTSVFHEVPIPEVSGSRCPSPTLGLSDRICISSNLSNSEVPPVPEEKVPILEVIPYWPKRAWFMLLTKLALCKPSTDNLLSQKSFIHIQRCHLLQNIEKYHGAGRNQPIQPTRSRCFRM